MLISRREPTRTSENATVHGILKIGCAEGPRGWGCEARFFGKIGAAPSPAVAASARQNLGKVERFGVGQLLDLLAATKAVGDHDCGWRRGLHGREKILVGDDLRHFEFI